MSIGRSPRSTTYLVHHLDANPLMVASDVTDAMGLKAPEISLSKFRWEQTQQHHNQALQSGFVQGIRNASLNPEGFGKYTMKNSFTKTYFQDLKLHTHNYAKLWPWIGKEIAADTGNFGVYTQWENFNPDSSGVIKYESLIDRTEAQGVINRNEALQVYTKSMMGEVNFFDSIKTI
ncbi:uncharacterized protein LOC128230758 [Mya arenaria]|uniref:uncharacterized protein LOC128230758 n=1 Tax=Mya arenaria TaxID=6604 RepID=UPI0022E442E8|nr:uncharacterized protein LOC128230758 [Mya arenaria]